MTDSPKRDIETQLETARREEFKARQALVASIRAPIEERIEGYVNDIPRVYQSQKDEQNLEAKCILIVLAAEMAEALGRDLQALAKLEEQLISS